MRSSVLPVLSLQLGFPSAVSVEAGSEGNQGGIFPKEL